MHLFGDSQASSEIRNKLSIPFVRTDERERNDDSLLFQIRNRKQEIDVVLVRPELRRVKHIRLSRAEPLDHIRCRGFGLAEHVRRRRMRHRQNVFRRNLKELSQLITADLGTCDDLRGPLQEPPMNGIASVPQSQRAHLRKPRCRAMLKIPNHGHERNVRTIGLRAQEPDELNSVRDCDAIDIALAAPVRPDALNLAESHRSKAPGAAWHRHHAQAAPRQLSREGCSRRLRT